ncbi:MAG: RNA polymerase sigma factor [Microbacteriaceae bacterium]|nr:RNA polymerase sigma factor [Microbacteriaceae bacterium]
MKNAPKTRQNLPDETLVARALDGDEKCFNEILRRYTGMMIAYAYQITNSQSDAEDATQEAFITAWHNLDTLSKPKKVKSWLMRIVGRKAIDIVRGRKITIDVNERADLATSLLLEPERQSELNQQLDQVQKMLAEMPELQRQCWVLREIAGYPYKEIAAELDVNEPTVRGGIARARKHLLAGMEAWQ